MWSKGSFADRVKMPLHLSGCRCLVTHSMSNIADFKQYILKSPRRTREIDSTKSLFAIAKETFVSTLKKISYLACTTDFFR